MARLPSRLFTRADVEKKCYLDERSMRDQLKSLSHHWRDGEIPRGSARAREVAKQQIGVTDNSRAPDWVLFPHKSRKCIFFFFYTFLSIFIFSFSSILKNKLLWNACAGHIPLHSENLPRATKNELAGHFRPAGQNFGHPWSMLKNWSWSCWLIGQTTNNVYVYSWKREKIATHTYTNDEAADHKHSLC